MAELSDTIRLVYIGLWMEADDAGYIRTDTTEIAMDLYPLMTRATRENRVAGAMEALLKAGRLVSVGCGKHLTIPTLTEHQRLSSPEKRVHTFQREHARECAIPADTRGSSQVPRDIPHTPDTERIGKGREGKGRGGVGGTPVGVETVQEPTEFARLVPRPGAAA